MAGDVATNPGPCSFIPNGDAKNSSDLKVLYLNARSLKSFVSIDDNPTKKVCKITLLQEFVQSGSYEVICICETWLNNTVLDAELLPGFNIFRRDRTVKTGGGVLIAVKEGLQASRRFDLERVGVELIAIQLSKANNKPVIIYVYYRPPGFCSDGLLLLNNSLLSNQESNCIVLVGDFNLPSISWSDNHSTPVNSGCADGELLCELIGDYNRANFSELRKALSQADFNSLLTDNIDNCWDQWKVLFSSIVTNYVPTKCIKDTNSRPWIDAEVRHLMCKKYTALRNYRKNRTAERVSLDYVLYVSKSNMQ